MVGGTCSPIPFQRIRCCWLRDTLPPSFRFLEIDLPSMAVHVSPFGRVSCNRKQKKNNKQTKKKLGYHSVRSNGSTSARASGNGGVGNKLCRKNPPDGAVTCPLDGPAPDAVNQKKKEILVYSRSPVDSNTKSNLAQRPNIGEWDGPKSSRAIVGRPRKTRW